MEKNKDTQPLVSIVIFTYNSAQFVLETLESAKAQTYQNIELIVTDDGSKDNTVQICRDWLKANGHRFVRTELVTVEKNTGIAANLNRGVRASMGKWFKLLAGDDLLLKDCIQINIDIINNSTSEISIINTPKISFNDTEKTETIKIEPQKWDWPLFFHDNISSSDQLRLAVRYIRPSVNGHFMKKNLYEKIGGCDEGFPMHEDRPLLIRILSSGVKIYGSELPTVLYRIHDNSVFRKNTKKLIYTNWFIESYIPVVEKYYYPYLSKIEIINYKIYFIYAKTIYGTFFNKNIFINKIFDKFIKFAFFYIIKYHKKIIYSELEIKYLS